MKIGTDGEEVARGAAEGAEADGAEADEATGTTTTEASEDGAGAEASRLAGTDSAPVGFGACGW